MVAETDLFHIRFAQALNDAGIPDDRKRRGYIAKTFDVSIEGGRKGLAGLSIPNTGRIQKISRELLVAGEWLLTGSMPVRSHAQLRLLNFRRAEIGLPPLTAAIEALSLAEPATEYAHAGMSGQSKQDVDAEIAAFFTKMIGPGYALKHTDFVTAMEVLLEKLDKQPDEVKRISKAVLQLMK